MRKKNVILVLVVCLAFISSFVVAGSIDECNSALKLTTEQQKKMQKMCLDFQKKMLPFQNDLKAKSLDMKTLLHEEADLSKLNAKIDEIAKIRAEIMKKKLAHHNQIMGLLSEEQKALFGKSGLGCVTGCGMEASGMHGKGMSCSKGCGGMEGKNMQQCSCRGTSHGKIMENKKGCKK